MSGSHQGLADVARRQGQYEQALEHVDAALAIDPLPTMTSRSLLDLRREIEQERQKYAELEFRVAFREASPEDYGALGGVDLVIERFSSAQRGVSRGRSGDRASRRRASRSTTPERTGTLATARQRGERDRG